MPLTTGRFGHENGPKQCTAMSKRSQEQCKGPAVLGSANQKCRMHGGNSAHAVGPSNKAFRHGRHSKFLPSRLGELYEEALANPNLIEMNDHIALLEARIQDILSGMDEGEPQPRWSDIKDVWDGIQTAVLSGDSDSRMAGLERMNTIIEAGMRFDRTWVEVNATLEQLRKMTDTEVKRKKDLHQMVPIERVTILVSAVGEAVKRNVTNPDEINAVYREIAMLYGGTHTAEGTPRVGPEVIDVPTSDNRGVGGGASKPALARKRKRIQQGAEA